MSPVGAARPRAATALQAYVLHRHDWSESSPVLDLFTRERGRLVVAAKGAKRPYSQLRPVLLPFQRISVTLARASADETFVTVQAGLGFRFAFDTKESFPIVRRVTLGAKAAYGASIPTGDGDPEGAFRVEAEIAAWFCDEGAAYFGYRYTGGDYDGDDMRLEGSLQGLRAGIRVEF